MARPYKILEKISNLYKVDLLGSIKVHPVFSLDWFWKAADNPLPGQYNDLLQPIKVNGEAEWEVDDVLAVH
jgi:hypothetical protein